MTDKTPAEVHADRTRDVALAMTDNPETRQDALDMAKTLLEQARYLMGLLVSKGEALVPRELLGLTGLDSPANTIRVGYDKGCDLVSMWTCQAGALAQLAAALPDDLAGAEWDTPVEVTVKGRQLVSQYTALSEDLHLHPVTEPARPGQCPEGRVFGGDPSTLARCTLDGGHDGAHQTVRHDGERVTWMFP